MFNPNDIVCVLIPNVVNSGYDYRLTDTTGPADIGNFVLVSVMNHPYVGVVIGPGTSGMPPEKIKPVLRVYTVFGDNPDQYNPPTEICIPQISTPPQGGSNYAAPNAEQKNNLPPLEGKDAPLSPCTDKDTPKLSSNYSPIEGESTQPRCVGGGIYNNEKKYTRTAVAHAKKLRQNMTDAERLLWYYLKVGQLGFDFRKQQAIGNYIADFVCIEKKLIIEIDGAIHGQKKQIFHDIERDHFLQNAGYRILRFWNTQIFKEMDNIKRTIHFYLINDEMPELRKYESIPPGAQNGAVPQKKGRGELHTIGLSGADLAWIYKMADWTMMAPGAVLKLILNIPDAFEAPRTEPLYTYNIPDKKIRMTDRRLAVADAFAMNDNDPMTMHDIQNIARVSPAVVKSMIDAGYLAPVGERLKTDIQKINYVDTGNITLNNEQSAAANALDLSRFGVHVLDGITGSGKTQVYFDAAMRVYAAGRSVLLMMPEIALTAQFMTRFRDRFGAVPIVWHSNLTAGKRRDIWRAVATGDIKIVVGTRSALFLPWRDLGLIVVDEEHDASYKQEDMGNYHARDMAILRGKIQDFPIILASATPSAETMKNIQTGNYTRSKLTSRFGGATLPAIELIDMRHEKKSAERRVQSADNNQKIELCTLNSALSNLSPSLTTAISETLTAGRQVMLFINRRGYAPIAQCKKCGWHADCPDCSVGMVYHKSKDALLCHICGRTTPMPKTCPACGAPDLSTTGVGIEKIEAEVNATFPSAKTAIVSSDTINSRMTLERLVRQMENHEIDVIIGTQILAKGHHFPNLTLVGVIDADMGLFGTDFRAAEKTFAQLFQVAGRAGRGDIPGRVLIQTYQPDHPVLCAIRAGDRDAFMATDLAGRKLAGMPPYGQLIAIIAEGEKEQTLQKFCTDLAARAPTAPGVRVFGPIPAQIYRQRNWYRMRFLIMAPEKTRIQDFAKHWLRDIKIPANIKLKIDVSPQNFM